MALTVHPPFEDHAFSIALTVDHCGSKWETDESGPSCQIPILTNNFEDDFRNTSLFVLTQAHP